MKQTASLFIILIIGVMTIISCSNKEQREQAERMIDAAHQQKDYTRLLTLADSLSEAGALSQANAFYWRGYAHDRLKQKKEAESDWRQAMQLADDEDDMEVYEKSASRLANLLCLSGDYKGTLAVAQPALKRLDELQRDTTSDYINLLIYTGLSQVSTGTSHEDAEKAFLTAREKHRQNIERNRCDATYKDAIAGLVNIAYYCVNAGKYEDALYYTSTFGELVGEYELRPGVDSAYVDRQIGRYTIYTARALYELGRKKEAAETYEAFLDTKYSKTPEGIGLDEAYQKVQ